MAARLAATTYRGSQVYALHVRYSVLSAGLSVALFVALGSVEARAQGVDRSVCVAAAERGQELRDAKKLRDARGQFTLCARDECPAAVSAECKRWRAEAEAALGSVVLEVVDAKGERVTKARILIDGAVWTDEITREPLFLDPGSHEIKIERTGSEPVVRNVTLAMGERDKVVKASLADLATKPGGPDSRKEADTPNATAGSSTPVVPIVLGVVGLAAAGTAVAFWLLGNSDLDEARERCRAGCADSEADSARTKHIIGDVAMGVAVVAVGAAVVLWLTRTTPKSAPASTAAPLVVRF